MAEKIYEKEGLDYFHYDDLTSYQIPYAGYAHHYIEKRWNKSTLVNEAKLEHYECLFEIDRQLGSKAEAQLYNCCKYLVNLNIIEVLHTF